jgi:hypothetical protein
MEAKQEFNLKLPRGAGLILVILILVGGGITYMVKPELIKQVIATGEIVLDNDRILPEMETELKAYLHSAVINALVASKAPQADFNKLGSVEILTFEARPQGFFRNEPAFWLQNDLRRVDYTTTFRLGGKQYTAEGTFSVDRIGNQIVLYDAQLL